MSDSRKSSVSRDDAQKHEPKYKPSAEEDVDDEEEEKDSLFSEQEERKCL